MYSFGWIKSVFLWTFKKNPVVWIRQVQKERVYLTYRKYWLTMLSNIAMALPATFPWYEKHSLVCEQLQNSTYKNACWCKHATSIFCSTQQARLSFIASDAIATFSNPWHIQFHDSVTCFWAISCKLGNFSSSISLHQIQISSLYYAPIHWREHFRRCP